MLLLNSREGFTSSFLSFFEKIATVLLLQRLNWKEKRSSNSLNSLTFRVHPADHKPANGCLSPYYVLQSTNLYSIVWQKEYASTRFVFLEKKSRWNQCWIDKGQLKVELVFTLSKFVSLAREYRFVNSLCFVVTGSTSKLE